jgi:hypothetical protein
MWGLMISILAMTWLLAGPAEQTAQPALRVVVLEGEDGVNIIQQKTAVRPIVEVRDRNNLPVPGALVTFSIEGGKAATFGGASTLTVATNAAGQAAVTGLTPSAAGAFQIQVSAAFQGQVATATIAQTNVLTAAQAAAAAGANSAGASGAGGGGAGGGGAAGGAGGAAGGAGGLSVTTIAVAGAAVAGGAVAAVQIADKVAGGSKFTGSFSGTITGSFAGGGGSGCTYTRSVTATAKLGFTDESDSAVSGEFEYEGTQTTTAGTCQDPFTTGPWGGGLEVTGSPSSFSGRRLLTLPSSTGGAGTQTITASDTLTIQGSMNGDTATVTFTYEHGSLAVGGLGGNVTEQAIGTFTVNLRKS